jgi:hypothetical protein
MMDTSARDAAPLVMQERRQNVRVRPTGDYNVGIDFGSGIVKVQLSVVNAAVGGVALVLEELIVDMPVGADIRLGITLPGVPRFETVGTIRYTQRRLGGRCGVHFNRLTQEQQVALSRAVSELLERGFAV